jgi:hypothetical protein
MAHFCHSPSKQTINMPVLQGISAQLYAKDSQLDTKEARPFCCVEEEGEHNKSDKVGAAAISFDANIQRETMLT